MTHRKKKIMRYCQVCWRRTPHEYRFDEEEVEHLACVECGSITYLHPA